MPDSSPKLVNGDEIEEKLDEYMRSRIGPTTRMQCKVCWHIYDPAEGSPEWGVPPETSFLDLPEDWTCPDCGHPKSAFIPLDDDIQH
jgi:rubredoxin